ncbi:MAG TPA: hypothetical protein VK879_18315 [Candidatus Sulfomarinibacteraceae bacterium]|nr:hypothetical protein [Candidatus Sulfomarinibacteraceae bacterium]
MNGYFNSLTENFALYLPDGMPLLSPYTQVEVDIEEPYIRLNVLVDDTSAEFLEESEMIEGLELPETSPLEPVYVQLWLEAHDDLLQEYAGFLNSDEDPAATIANIEAPMADDDPISPFYQLANYKVTQWAIHETQLASDEFVELSKKPPMALDDEDDDL